MSSLLGHTRALQVSATAALLTAALTALPLLASDQFDESYYADQVVQTFQKMGAVSGGSYSNGSLDTSAFDFAIYFSHTCYRPTDFDMPMCKEKFGPYAHLKQTYDSGKLASILSRVSYLKDIAKIIPNSGVFMESSSSSSSVSSVSSASSETITPSSSISSSADRMDRADRATQVWNLCVQKFIFRDEQVACYQRNIRLIMDRLEPVETNLVY